MNGFSEELNKRLSRRATDGTLRTLTINPGLIDFYSNDYLGLSRMESPFSSCVTSPGSSRLIAGTQSIHVALESALAQQFRSQRALLFNSGYAANIGLFSAIGWKDSIFLYDEHCHASIKDGIRLGHAESFSFKHNNAADLERLLNRFKGKQCFTVVESLYSIEGDFAPLAEIAKLCAFFDVPLLVDEAHTGGVFGTAGYCEFLGITDLVTARIFTFGKAYGSQGSCIVGQTQLIDYLINYARSFIYTTALPSTVIHEIQQKVIESELETKQTQLQHNISTFREQVKKFQLQSDPLSPIQSILVKSSHAAISMQKTLEFAGVSVKAILSPTVSKSKESLRISIHSFNTKKEMNTLVELLNTYGDKAE